MNRHFLNIIHGTIEYTFEWYKFYNKNLSVVLGSKQGNFETRETQTQGLSVNSTADSLSINFLLYFAEMSSFLSMKTSKSKVTKCLRFDLANRKYTSIFLGLFATFVKVTQFFFTQKFPPSTCQNKYINKHSINPKYIKQ